MPISELHVSGYRSIRDVRLKLGPVNVLVGPNGCGKSNLYQSIYLLARSAQGELARTLAREGGMPSVMWAGAWNPKKPKRMSLEVEVDEFEYELTCGLPQALGTVFKLDPEIKEESVRLRDRGTRRVNMLHRSGASLMVRDVKGNKTQYPREVSTSESALSQLREPNLYPELAVVREEMSSWRFYHHFRTDPDSPIRQPQIGIRTPVLSHDGSDLAAVLQTIREIGDAEALDEAVENAFPGSALQIDVDRERMLLRIMMSVPGLNRSLDARELSDGTLRYLCLLGALLGPRPPSLMALNEPETSLHPDLLDPLGRLVAQAASRSQLWIATHSVRLAERIEAHSGEPAIRLALQDGETSLANRTMLGD